MLSDRDDVRRPADMPGCRTIHDGKDEGASPRLRKSVLLRISKLTVFAMVFGFVCRELAVRLISVRWSEIELSVPFLAMAFFAAILAKSTRVLALRTVLWSFGKTPDLLSMMTVAWVPEIGKYLPGKIASVAGSVWLLRRKQVSSAAAIGGVFVVDGIRILVGLGLAVPLTFWAPVRQALPAAWAWCAGLLTFVLVCLHPKVFGAAANFALRKLERQQMRSLPGLRQYVGAAALVLVQFSALGFTVWCTGRSVAVPRIAHVPLFVSAVGLAGTAGLLAVFAPAGLGVREGILLVVLGPVFGSNTAAVVVVTVRLVLTIVEVLLAAAGLVILKLQSSSERRCRFEARAQ